MGALAIVQQTYGVDEKMKKEFERQARYDKKSTKGIYLKLNIGTDGDILARLADVPSTQGYIKGLIRADIKKIKKSAKTP